MASRLQEAAGVGISMTIVSPLAVWHALQRCSITKTPILEHVLKFELILITCDRLHFLNSMNYLNKQVSKLVMLLK